MNVGKEEQEINCLPSFREGLTRAKDKHGQSNALSTTRNTTEQVRKHRAILPQMLWNLSL